MTNKSNNTNGNRSTGREQSGHLEKVIINDSGDIALNRQLPTSGQKTNIEIMQRTATPPNPNGGNTPTKK
ncbi:hypothetical protein RJD40_20830 [Vibrio scophthalmi]|uniref:hypothetical protein n=1 Tax=Vibrio scophthalmi TaxID=45658 RepID=UPI003AB09198